MKRNIYRRRCPAPAMIRLVFGFRCLTSLECLCYSARPLCLCTLPYDGCPSSFRALWRSASSYYCSLLRRLPWHRTSITSWRLPTTMGTSIPIPTCVSGYSITQPGLSMSARLSSQHRNSSTCLNFQQTPFCCHPDYTRPALLALLPATNHVISIRAILARLSLDNVLAVVFLEHVIVRGISCDPLYGAILSFAHYVSASSV